MMGRESEEANEERMNCAYSIIFLIIKRRRRARYGFPIESI